MRTHLCSRRLGVPPPLDVVPSSTLSCARCTSALAEPPSPRSSSSSSRFSS